MKTAILNITPGQTVEFHGEPCIVLEHRKDGTLLLGAEYVKHTFGSTNNFAASSLRAHLNSAYLDALTENHPDEIITRTVDLTALNGSKEYEVRLLENIVNLVYILKTKIYRPGVFRVFYVYEPKKRLVQAPAFVDKVVQHAIVDNLLYDRITRSFILDNYASQKNKGLHFGLDRLKGFFTDYWNKHHTAEGWVLKCDVRHFFASINHDKLKEKLKKLDLEPVVYDLLCIYIDCSDGLPLGYQTSQLFALLFLDDFDHFVKEQLHIQYYGRYMDDFFLIHPDKEYLQFCLREIRAYMDSLGLELNEKTQIFPIRNGIDFLGFHTYLTESGKVIRKLRRSSIKRMRAKLRHWEKEYPAGLVTREQILQSWQAWDAHAAHGNTWALRQQVRDRVQNILKEEI